MAQSITNKQFVTYEAAFQPAASKLFADQTLVGGTLAVATTNTAIVGLQWMRVRARLKTINGITAGERFRMTCLVGTGAAVTGPENIIQVGAELSTGATETSILVQGVGWSQTGFQSYSIILEVLDVGGVTPSADVTSVIDLMVDCA